MKLLPDENLPKRLKVDFAPHEIYTVRDKGWNGIKNGLLLKLMLENQFEALITFGKNLQNQQSFQKHFIAVYVLTAFYNINIKVKKLVPQIHAYLLKKTLPEGPVIISNLY